MSDLTPFLSRWYAASIGKEDKAKVIADFNEATKDNAKLKAEAAARYLRPSHSILMRDHISRVHNEFLEKVK